MNFPFSLLPRRRTLHITGTFSFVAVIFIASLIGVADFLQERFFQEDYENKHAKLLFHENFTHKVVHFVPFGQALFNI